MATLIKGLLAASLDWQFVLVGVSIAITMELCGVRALAFAVGAYLPLSTTLPIFCGGVIRHFTSVKNGTTSDGHGGKKNSVRAIYSQQASSLEAPWRVFLWRFLQRVPTR